MLKQFVVTFIVALGLGLYVGKLYFAKSESIETEREVIKRDVVTVVKEITRPDGTKESTTTTTDHSKESKENTLKIVVADQRNWHVSVSYLRGLSDPAPVYGLQVERKILGPVSVGLNVNSQKQIGVVIGFEF
jgi:uncharacterized protein (DUF58 family)